MNNDKYKVPDGWKLVPLKPTDEMVVAFAEVWYSRRQAIDDPQMDDAYVAMLAASASPDWCPECHARESTPDSTSSAAQEDALPLLRNLKKSLMHQRRFGTDDLNSYRSACVQAEADIEEFLAATKTQ